MNPFCRPAQWLALALTLAASPALAASGPSPGFTLTDDAELAFASPDKATWLEQYMKDGGDFDIKWQVLKWQSLKWQILKWQGLNWQVLKWQVSARNGEAMTELKPNNVTVKGPADWRCRYDLKSGTFDVPAMFAKTNAEALRWEIRR